MIRVGIIGLGRMGLLHTGIVSSIQGASVVAVCEKEYMLLKIAKRVLPRFNFYDNIGKMVDAELLDAVFITTPINTHVSLLDQILSNKNRTAIFCEKPLASTYADALRISNIAKDSITMIGFQKRYSPLFRRAKELIDQGVLGDLLFFKSYSYITDVFKSYNGWRYRVGSGGVVLDFGAHLIDLLLWFFGEPQAVKAVKHSFYSEAEDFVHAILQYPKLVGSLEACWSIRNYRLPEFYLEVYGENGKLAVNDDYLRVELEEDVKGIIQQGKYVFYRPSFDTSVSFLLGEPEYTLEDAAFISSVISNSKCEPDFNTAIKVNRLIETIHEMPNQ